MFVLGGGGGGEGVRAQYKEFCIVYFMAETVRLHKTSL